ncbi:P27 family phage terminase small subunit [Streptacidiphilus rugosus]|uniref:P27 family phage terminase small subunit n=1 Tax=Streptacidiphilus rugosus TaxID=405783 RepID=UPI0012FCA456|nr:P27 family phage terminase small subunit [Streptacidiphilus rugosus]
MPRTKKPAGTVADRRNGRRTELTAVQGARLALPTPPPGVEWCDDAVAAWERYWDDPVAQALTPADGVLVLRWLEAVNRHLITSREADKSPLSVGSQGQMVLNPLYKAAEMALRTAEACERQLGIGPAHRASLGIALLTEKRTLADLNTAYREAVAHDDDVDEDPRLGAH